MRMPCSRSDSIYSRAPIRQGRARTKFALESVSSKPRFTSSAVRRRRSKAMRRQLAAQQAQSRMAAAPAHRAVRFTL